MVTHCICHGRSFVELKRIAEEQNITKLQQLIEKEYCCCGCQLCFPYIEMMLSSGRTCFRPEEAAALDKNSE